MIAPDPVAAAASIALAGHGGRSGPLPLRCSIETLPRDVAPLILTVIHRRREVLREYDTSEKEPVPLNGTTYQRILTGSSSR